MNKKVFGSCIALALGAGCAFAAVAQVKPDVLVGQRQAAMKDQEQIWEGTSSPAVRELSSPVRQKPARARAKAGSSSIRSPSRSSRFFPASSRPSVRASTHQAISRARGLGLDKFFLHAHRIAPGEGFEIRNRPAIRIGIRNTNQPFEAGIRQLKAAMFEVLEFGNKRVLEGLDHGVGHFRPLSLTRQRRLLAYHDIAINHEDLCQVF